MDAFEAIASSDLGRLRQIISLDPAASAARNSEGTSLLSWAAYMGNADAIAIVRSAAPVLGPYEAIILGDAERVSDLLANDWDGRELSPDGFTPLSLAAFFGQQDVFDLLLPLADDVNRRADNRQQVAALHAATAKGSARMVQQLLDAGADPNLPQAGGFVPLHAAAASGKAAIVDMLLAAGADPRRVNDKCETAADLARADGHTELAARLEQALAPG